MINESQDELVLEGFIFVATQSKRGCEGCGFLARGDRFDLCSLTGRPTLCTHDQRDDGQDIIWLTKVKND